MSTIIQSLEKEQLKRRPRFIAGDRVRVHFQVIEGTRTRTQVFEGVVIKRQGSGVRETFTVRKQSFGVGVERTFPLHSPKIERLELAAHGDVRRAKLYYLRDRVGKAARVAERRWGIADEMLDTDGDGALDAEGTSQVEAPQAVPAESAEEGTDDAPELKEVAQAPEAEVAEEPDVAEGAEADKTEAAGDDAEAATEDAEEKAGEEPSASSEPAGEPEGDTEEPAQGSDEGEASAEDA